MEIRNVYRCLMSPDSSYLAKAKQTTITVCSAENAKVEYGKITASGGVTQYCFSPDSKNLAVLSINGSLSIYDISENQGPTLKTRIRIEAKWRGFNDIYFMFYVNESGIILTPRHSDQFMNDIILVDINTNEQRLLYHSEYMFRSLTMLKNQKKLFVVETTTLVDPLPARFTIIDLSGSSKQEITPEILFERKIKNGEDLPNAITNDDATTIFVSTSKNLERYDRIDGSYKLTLSKAFPNPKRYSEFTKLGMFPYAIQEYTLNGFYLVSLESLDVKKRYLMCLNGLSSFSVSPCGRYAFFPTCPQRQSNGKYTGGWNVFMADIERFIEGDYDQYFLSEEENTQDGSTLRT